MQHGIFQFHSTDKYMLPSLLSAKRAAVKDYGKGQRNFSSPSHAPAVLLIDECFCTCEKSSFEALYMLHCAPYKSST